MNLLRPYQEQLNTDILSKITEGHQRILAVMPTGAGKGTTICALVKAFSDVGKRCYILAHRNELVGDLSNRIQKLGIAHGVISPHYPEELNHFIQVGSVQTVARRLHKLPKPDIIIQDEAHHLVVGNTWGKVIDYWPEAILIGKTATPVRLSGQGLGEGHGGYFTSMVVGPSADWLTENGYLSSSKVYAPPIGFSADKVKKSRGDFDMKMASQQMKAGQIMGDVISHYKKYLKHKTVIAFCCSVEHAEDVANSFNKAGINAASIDGSMNIQRRAKLLSDLESGKLKILTSCALIGEGIDIPNVSGCILLRPTTSISLHLQMIGRCLRYQEGKTAIILDHVGNTIRLGHYIYFNEDDWSLESKKIDKTSEADAIKVCPDCHSLIPRNSKECSECGHNFTIDPVELAVLNGELVEFSPYEELRPVIEPMVEEGMGVKRISMKLFEMGHTNSLGKKIAPSTLSKILNQLGLKTKTESCMPCFSDEQLKELRPIIVSMIEEGMERISMPEKLFELGYTNTLGNKMGESTLYRVLNNLELIDQNKSNISQKLEQFRPVIESMIEEGKSYAQICSKLAEMGCRDGKGNLINTGSLFGAMRKLGLKTKNLRHPWAKKPKTSLEDK
jgi:superfamily II DNA or RNA helicase